MTREPLVYVREAPADDPDKGTVELCIIGGGHDVQLPLSARTAARLTAELAAFLWRVEQRRRPPS